MTDERFEKVYTDDNYSKVFANLHNRFAMRGQTALAPRKTDKNPQPNATTIIYLKDDPSGDVRISGTGDFVEFYNRRKGVDSIGATRRAFEIAVQKQEEKMAREGLTHEPVPVYEPNAKSDVLVQSLRPRVNFMQAIFAMMLILSLVLLSVTSMLLERVDAAVLAARAEVGEITALSEKSECSDAARSEQAGEAITLSLNGEDSVVIHTVEEQSFSFATLLDALASLAK